MKRKIVIITLLLFWGVGSAVFLTVYNQKGFTGSRIANRFEAEKGSLYMEIKALDGTA